MDAVCSVPNCARHATDRGRCAIHTRPRMNGWHWARVVATVVARDHGVCWLCGRPGANSADHVVPHSRGGTDALENLRAAHLACNLRRGIG
jgi:5-methylcytosine-specific restriction endonuclease McrA